jgi:hypothetical protein
MHKTCADIVKWKPKMKCNACEDKSIKDLYQNKSKIAEARRLGKSTNKHVSNVKN